MTVRLITGQNDKIMHWHIISVKENICEFVVLVQVFWTVIKATDIFIFSTELCEIILQSTLVISKSKGPSETLRDIPTSTYQIWRTEENTDGTTKLQK